MVIHACYCNTYVDMRSRSIAQALSNVVSDEIRYWNDCSLYIVCRVSQTLKLYVLH